MYNNNLPHRRYEYSPTEKKNMVKFWIVVVIAMLAGMGCGWLLITLL